LLIRAIESVLSQTYPSLEIIIVDDGSTDDTESIISNKYKNHSNVGYINNRISKGACYARNIGIEASKGVFITGLDDDDEYHKDRLMQLYSNYNSSISFTCCHSIIFSNDAQFNEPRKKSIITAKDLIRSNLVGSQVLVEKERIKKIGMFDVTLASSQDHDMWYRLTKEFGPALKLPSELYICHIDKSIERVSDKKLIGYLQFYKKHKNDMSLLDKTYHWMRYFRSKYEKKIPFAKNHNG